MNSKNSQEDVSVAQYGTEMTVGTESPGGLERETLGRQLYRNNRRSRLNWRLSGGLGEPLGDEMDSAPG